MNDSRTEASAGRRLQWRRWISLVMIVTSTVLVLLGQSAWAPRLGGLRFFAYWGLCSLLTVLALGTAFWDMVAIRHDAAREKQRLLDEALLALHKNLPDKPVSRTSDDIHEKS